MHVGVTVHLKKVLDYDIKACVQVCVCVCACSSDCFPVIYCELSVCLRILR